MIDPTLPGLTYAELEAKRAALFDNADRSDLGLRMRRAISWLERAEREKDDPDAAFIFYWISFNAAYAADIDFGDLFSEAGISEHRRFRDYFHKVVSLDEAGLISDAVLHRFHRSVRPLLLNKFVFQPFWDFYNGKQRGDNWESRFAQYNKEVGAALNNADAITILISLFNRLYVLRNQLVHGGATWNSSVNRRQVRDGAEIMAFMVPAFINLMLEHREVDWGPPYYPVVR